MTSNFNHQLRKIKSSVSVCLCLKTAFHDSTKAKIVDKVGEDVLTHCERHSKDALELVGLCKLLYFAIYVAMFAV